MFNKKYKERIKKLERQIDNFHKKTIEKDIKIFELTNDYDDLQNKNVHLKTINEDTMIKNKELADKVELLKKENTNLKRKNTILNKKVKENA